MTKFVAGNQVETPDSSVVVDAGLSVGLHRFRLEVVTDAGRKSPPAEVLVQVLAATATVGIAAPLLSPTDQPTPVLSPVPIASPVATPSIVSVAPTLPKTMPPSATSPNTRKKKR